MDPAAQRLTAVEVKTNDSSNLPLPPPRQFHGSSHTNLRLFENRSDYHKLKQNGYFARDHSISLDEPGENDGAARPAVSSSITFDQFYAAVVKPSSESEESLPVTND